MSIVWSNILTDIIQVGIKLLIAAVIVTVGWILSTKIAKAVKQHKRIKEIDDTAASFLASTVNIAIKVVLIVIAISILGVPTASVAAIIASAGVAIGLALQGGLSNIASGIILVVFKPFRVGDFITVGSDSGTVIDLSLFYTVLRTPDNKRVSLPNSLVSGSALINVSAEPLRRVDFTFVTAHSSNSELVKKALETVAKKNSMVLTTPAPSANINSITDKGIEYTLKVWCESANYWDVYFALNSSVKDAFEMCEIEISHPQLDVHIKN